MPRGIFERSHNMRVHPTKWTNFAIVRCDGEDVYAYSDFKKATACRDRWAKLSPSHTWTVYATHKCPSWVLEEYADVPISEILDWMND